MVIDAVSGVIVDAKGAVTPLSKARRRSSASSRRVWPRPARPSRSDSANCRRAGQNAADEIGKRRKQAEDAASDVTSVASRIASLAASAAGSAVRLSRRHGW
jgi:hypothetical protein